MRCETVACVWPESPPTSHRVTAVAALDHPPTLYTGGSDGAIVWWNLSGADDGNESRRDIKPFAMLCGHSAPIADLGICSPSSTAGDEQITDSSNLEPNSTSVNYGALISACTDGVLCVWSRNSGHCRRRRKMPPWVGSPCMVRPVTENRRYVCIACCFIDSLNSSDLELLDSHDCAEPVVNRESHRAKSSKCTIVVIDSYTLTVVQTVFHGFSSIGPLKYIEVVMPFGNLEKQSVLMVDSLGNMQSVPILKDLDQSGVVVNDSQRNSSHMEQSDVVHEIREGDPLISFTTHGQVLAFLYRSCCIFRLVGSGSAIGEISFLNSQLSPEGNLNQSFVTGCAFLEADNPRMVLPAEECHDSSVKTFAVWNSKGFVIMYSVSYSEEEFKFDPLCSLLAVSYPPYAQLSLSFIQINCYFLRIESICFQGKEPLQWEPHITIWSLPFKDGDNRLASEILGGGKLFHYWTNSNFPHSTEGFSGECNIQGNNFTLQQSHSTFEGNLDGSHANKERNGSCQKGVSSSMVISDNYFSPYAVVYGFYTGEIEVLRFDMFFEELDYHGGSPRPEAVSCSKQHLSGHTGAVLCLAAHQMASTSGWNCKHYLISGSMDCTICIWDLNSCNLITVLHHHVLPVRQIILPPPHSDRPWSDCFLSVGDDCCIALASLETLRVERIFPGHPYFPAKVVWDSARGYIQCLCPNRSGTSDAHDVLYIWDVKSGARERVLRGTAAHSMFEHFCSGHGSKTFPLTSAQRNTSTSSLLFPIVEDAHFLQSHPRVSWNGNLPPITSMSQHRSGQSKTHPIKCSCPFPGLATMCFDTASLMSFCKNPELLESGSDTRGMTDLEGQGFHTPKNGNTRVNTLSKEDGVEIHSTSSLIQDDGSALQGTSDDTSEYAHWVLSLEGCLLRFTLSFLHLWDVDSELDRMLISEMKLKKPENYIVTSGLLGDRGSLTLAFPGPSATLEMWRMSAEFCAIRSLSMVSLAQHMISLSRSCSSSSSALAAFYTRNFAEKVPGIKPPLLQLLVSFWQDGSEHIRMAARSLFHCAASRAIPLPLCSEMSYDRKRFLASSNSILERKYGTSTVEENFQSNGRSEGLLENQRASQVEDSEIMSWLESFEDQDWISCVGGTSQDAMTSHIIVAGALAVWYPSLVKSSLAKLAVHPLTKLVMAMNEKFSSTAAEILAEGMESTWLACIQSDIPRLIADIFFQIECVSGASAKSSAQSIPLSLEIRETLVGTLLPSLAMADIPGFLNVIESQIWSTASDSPVHIISLLTLIRVLRGSPKNLALYIDKVVNFILHTMDPGNSVMRRTCFHNSMSTLKEVVRVFPMVALNESSTRLAVGDAIGEINNSIIRIYDMQSMTKVKVLDASGPPGLPALLNEASEMTVNTAISALSFSPDGEGVVAFSERGMMIRWWSLGSVWWERLSRNHVPVHCTKLIFVRPLEEFSSTPSRSGAMATAVGNEISPDSQVNTRDLNEVDRVKLLLHNLDLSYRLEWIGGRNVKLTRHGLELGTFQL